MQYSYEFKAQAVEKALNRGPDVSFNSVAHSCGIDYSTLRRWVTQFENQSYGEQIMNKEKTPRQWTREQKLQALIRLRILGREPGERLLQGKGNLSPSRQAVEKGVYGKLPKTRASEQGADKTAHRGEQVS